MTHEYPKSFARFYDIIYQHHRDGVDNVFFLNEINKTNGKILEIGVGTGRLFKDALKNGADIYGLDISQPMIDVLLGKIDSSQHNRISLQNIIDFNYNFEFDLIVAPFRVIMHLLDKEDQIRALNNVYSHLKEGGRFIFDVFVPNLERLINGFDKFTDFEGEYQTGKKLKRSVTTKPDLINQIINVTFHLEWEEDNELKHEDWETPMRFFFRYEMEHLLERTKFGKYKIFGDYQENELDKDSKEFVVVCQK